MNTYYAIELQHGKKVIRKFEIYMETSHSFVTKISDNSYIVYDKKNVFKTFSEALDVIEREK